MLARGFLCTLSLLVLFGARLPQAVRLCDQQVLDEHSVAAPKSSESRAKSADRSARSDARPARARGGAGKRAKASRKGRDTHRKESAEVAAATASRSISRGQGLETYAAAPKSDAQETVLEATRRERTLKAGMEISAPKSTAENTSRTQMVAPKPGASGPVTASVPSPSTMKPVRYDHEKALDYLQFARVSYCDPKNIQEWTCGEQCDATTIRPGSVKVIGPSPETQMLAYVAEKPAVQGKSKQCVLVFRGSSNVPNWLTNVRSSLTPWPPVLPSPWHEPADRIPGKESSQARREHEWCPGCEVHDGFAAAYEEVREEVIAAIQSFSCQEVVVTGHSLGGAIATLAAIDLRARPPQVVSREFGALEESGAGSAAEGASPRDLPQVGGSDSSSQSRKREGSRRVPRQSPDQESSMTENFQDLKVPEVFVFGSPRVGNTAFALAFVSAAQKQGAEVPAWRVVHAHDPIPNVPPAEYYEHVPIQVYYKLRDDDSIDVCGKKNGEYIPYTPCSFASIPSRIDLALEGGVALSDHILYLGKLVYSSAQCNGEPKPMLLDKALQTYHDVRNAGAEVFDEAGKTLSQALQVLTEVPIQYASHFTFPKDTVTF